MRGWVVLDGLTGDDATLFFQMTGQSAIRLEAIAENKFKVGSPPIEFEFDAAKNQLIQRRGGRETVFTKGK